jgi:hypothetical protein
MNVHAGRRMATTRPAQREPQLRSRGIMRAELK